MQGTPKDKRKQYNERKINIHIENDHERKERSKVQTEPSKNILPNLQPMSAKPPSGSQTLPTPRKYYHTHNERLRPRHGKEATTSIQLPFGGGQEFGNIKEELKVGYEQIISKVYNISIGYQG